MQLRPAAPDDAAALAELVDAAGEGLPRYLWKRMAGPGEDAWEIGQQRARREAGSFSYRNATVAVVDGVVAACLIGYPLADVPEAIDPALLPAMFVPLQELEDLAAGSWYINVVATFVEHRGKGIGSELLRHAERLAAATHRNALALIVADSNAGARRLYARTGYEEAGARAMVKNTWRHPGTNWVLLKKRL
jgi:ribosomal protein S18 acetylase RimI-like enzyme